METAGVTMNDCEIDHKLTENIVCPYCGWVNQDSGEVEGDNSNEDLGRCDCEECGGTFNAARNITITYSTNKIDWLKEWELWNFNMVNQREGVRATRGRSNMIKECPECGGELETSVIGTWLDKAFLYCVDCEYSVWEKLP